MGPYTRWLSEYCFEKEEDSFELEEELEISSRSGSIGSIWLFRCWLSDALFTWEEDLFELAEEDLESESRYGLASTIGSIWLFRLSEEFIDNEVDLEKEVDLFGYKELSPVSRKGRTSSIGSVWLFPNWLSEKGLELEEEEDFEEEREIGIKRKDFASPPVSILFVSTEDCIEKEEDPFESEEEEYFETTEDFELTLLYFESFESKLSPILCKYDGKETSS